MGEEQPRAEPNGQSGAGEAPDVIDLRRHEDAAHNGNGQAAADATSATPRSDTRSLSASEGWEWLDLGLRISDAQLQVRRSTARPMNIDRTDVMLRPSANGSQEPGADGPDEPRTEVAPEPAGGRPTRREWLNRLGLGRRTIDAAQTRAAPSNADPANADGSADHQVTGAPRRDDRAQARGVAGPAAEPEVAAQPDVRHVTEAPDEPATVVRDDSASGRMTARERRNWATLGRTINGDPAKPDGDDLATADAPADESEQDSDPSSLVDVAQSPETAPKDPFRALRRVGMPALGLVAVVLLVAVAAVLVLLLDDSPRPAPAAKARPSASARPSLAVKSFAVIWLEQNTAAGTRLLVPPELVDDFAAGLPGRQVLPNDDTAVRNGDLIVVTPNSGDVLEGTLTQQVLASAPVVARLPGSDLDVRQVIGPDATGDAARASAGTELSQNLGLTFVAGSAAVLRSGQVDERVLVILAGLAAQHSLTVALVHDPAEAPTAQVRTLQIRAVDGHPLTAADARRLEGFVTVQRGALAGPVVVQTESAASRAISVRYLLPNSVDLLTGGSIPTISEESP